MAALDGVVLHVGVVADFRAGAYMLVSRHACSCRMILCVGQDKHLVANSWPSGEWGTGLDMIQIFYGACASGTWRCDAFTS